MRRRRSRLLICSTRDAARFDVVSDREKRYAAASLILRQALRDSNRTAAKLARELDINPGTLKSYLDGWSAPRDNDVLWERLRGEVGLDTCSRYRTAVVEARRPKGNRYDPERQVLMLVRRGRFGEARHMVLHGRADLVISADVRLEVGRACFDRGCVDDGVAIYQTVLDYQQNADPTSVVATLEELAGRLSVVERYDDAIGMCRVELVRNTGSTALWRRLGILEWYGGHLVSAYASLSTALLLGASRPRVFHARGQVLAELGRFEPAIQELTEAIASPLSERSGAYARSTRAFALYMSGRESEGLEDFAVAEDVTPDNGWLHYFRAQCMEVSGRTDLARDGFIRALTCDRPLLNGGKRRFAEDYLARTMKTA